LKISTERFFGKAESLEAGSVKLLLERHYAANVIASLSAGAAGL
jgi:hypothetical protein